LTVSDTRDLDSDRSGKLLVDRLTTAGHTLVERVVVTDDRHLIAHRLRRWVRSGAVDVVLTTGGTGVTARDVTPEAVRDVIHKEIPGFGELFRAVSVDTIGTSTVQSRALGGVAARTYIFALPGSTGACKDAWDRILVHQLDQRHRPCNFAELLPRLVRDDGPASIDRESVVRATERWCALVEAEHGEGLTRLYGADCRVALPDAGHEGAKAAAREVLLLLGGRSFRYESLGGVQVEPGGQSATDVGALVEKGTARFVCTWVWRRDDDGALLHLQQIAPTPD
jgi:molybdenum cofactor biosynthesis protein B